ncbi:MAG: AmmeMemoRadiSam system protein B [Patescibacteria group bacterium]
MRRTIVLITSAAAVSLLCITAAVFVFVSNKSQATEGPVIKTNVASVSPSSKTTDTSLDLATTVSPEILDGAFKAKLDWGVQTGTRVLLVPHHLVAARQIASLLVATKKPSTVYLVTPDHLGHCKQAYCSDQETYKNELAVLALVPFLQRAWGNDIKIVPTIVRPDASAQQTTQLISDLTSNLKKDKKALLVFSIDASHYLLAEVADFHDILTQDVISSLADMEVKRAEIDAPAVLRVGLKTARDLGLGQVTIHAHTNSLRILQAKYTFESTSHFLASFAPGNISPQQNVSLLFLGDMNFDRNVATRSKSDKSYPFLKIAGTENRFFSGQDLIVANLEGPVTTKRAAPDKGNVDFMFDPKILDVLKKYNISAVSQANNHTYDQGGTAAQASRDAIKRAGLAVFGDQVKDDEAHALTIVESRARKIALLGFNITDNALDKKEAAQDIASAKMQADYTVVFMHWGAEYQAKPNKTQTDLAHWFIDQGVDAIIGSHPHWMESVEVYRNRPIAYSLGNFIFDQDWSAETNLGLAAGLVLNEQGSELHLFPIQITKSQPRLLTGTDRQTRLDYLASISDPSLSSQIKQGVIRLINK